jgi:hypothetical protein
MSSNDVYKSSKNTWITVKIQCIEMYSNIKYKCASTMYKITFQQCIKCAPTVYRILDDFLFTRLVQEA